MKLTTQERVIMLGIVSQKGNFEAMKVARSIFDKVNLTEEERKEFDVKVNEKGFMTWNDKGKKAFVDIDFNDFELTIIKKTLATLSDNQQLTIETVVLYERFCVNSAD